MIRTAGAATLLVLAAALAACGGDTGDSSDDADGSPSAEGSEPGDTGSDDASEGSSEEESEDEVTADTPPTPPGTVLEPDETAVVEIPYIGGGRGLYTVDLVSVSEQPLSKLPPDIPAEPGSTLWYVDQDWTMVDRGNGSVTGMNLSSHTSVSVGRDLQVPMLLLADTPGCSVAQFTTEDGRSGRTRESCSAYLLAKGEQIEQVWFFEFESDYDFSTGGSPVRWRVDDTA
jgi:hypothetical protein